MQIACEIIHFIQVQCNLVPRVLRLFGQRVGARRDSGVLELYYRSRDFCGKIMEAVTELVQSSQLKNLIFFLFSRVCPGAYPMTKKHEDSGYEIGFNAAVHKELSSSFSQRKVSLIPRTDPQGTIFVSEYWQDPGYKLVSTPRVCGVS